MSDFDRLPPHDLGAEQCVLGGMMLSAAVIGDVIEAITPADHYRPAHQIVHEVILEQYQAGNPCDALAVAGVLSKRGGLGKVGGADYLHTLIASVPTAANAGYFARQVKEKATLRRLVEAGTRIVQMGYGADDDAAKLVTRSQDEIDAVAASQTTAGTSAKTFHDLLTDVIVGLDTDPPARVKSPWIDLDALLRIAAGSFTVIGARPAVGKSTLGLQMAAHVAIGLGLPAVVFSLEMSREELMLRVLSSEARVPLSHLTHRRLDHNDWTRIHKTHQWIQAKPLTIIDDSETSLASIRATLRDMRRKTLPALVVVDYVQLMSSPGRSENRQTEVDANTRGLKIIARELGCAVVGVAQVNRGPEQRADKRPLLSDLRESGGFENHADNVLLLHREDLYDKTSPRLGEIDVIVAKQRNGPTGTVTLAYQGHYARATDMAA